MQALHSGNPWQPSFWLPPVRLSPKAKNIKASQEICLNFSFLFGSFTSWQHFNFSWPAFQNSGKENTKKKQRKNPKLCLTSWLFQDSVLPLSCIWFDLFFLAPARTVPLGNSPDSRAQKILDSFPFLSGKSSIPKGQQ